MDLKMVLAGLIGYAAGYATSSLVVYVKVWLWHKRTRKYVQKRLWPEMMEDEG